MREFKNSDQMKAFMRKESKRLNISINNIYNTFIARTVLERISKYNNHKILIKGSSASVMYLGRLVRPITDLDVASLGSADEVINYHVSGDRIEVVDIPTGYTHNIINLSKTENLVTVMWANEQFDASKPDTFFEIVEK